MGNIHLIGSFVFLWLCLPSPSHCQVTLFEVEKFPAEPVENGNVTLTCMATGFEPNAHLFSWKRFYNLTYIINVTLNERSSVSPPNLIADLVKLYSQSLTITNLTKSDEGSYLCEIITKDNENIIVNGQVGFTVNATEDFPVCFPDGPAVVNEGDILTCRTVIDERTPVVSDTSSRTKRTEWVETPLAVNDSGSRLQKSVKVSDDGVTFFCFSIAPEIKNWTSLSCKIGPLTVIPTRKPPTYLPDSTAKSSLFVGLITGITICVILFVGLVTIVVLYSIYRRKRTSSTNSDTGPNQQNPPHVYVTAILEDTQPSSSAKAELHNYANVNPSTSNRRGAHEDLSRHGPSSNTPSNQKDVMRQTDPYMELSPQEPALDVYTELKL